MDTKTALARAMEKLGGQNKMAQLCGVSEQAVSQWVSTGKIPPARCFAVSEATGISCRELRPDFFPADAA